MKKYLAVLLYAWLVLSTPAAFAQRQRHLSVTEFGQDQLDLTARGDKYKQLDDDGALYSIIKVKSEQAGDDLQSYRFDFGQQNSFVKHHPETEELWVYVQKDAKTVTIRRDGFIPLNKYDLRLTIGAGNTYTMLLSSAEPRVNTQMVLFRVKPARSKAVVVVKADQPGAQEDEVGTIDETGAVAKDLPFGTYTYTVTSELYHSSEGRFTLSNATDTHSEDVALRANYGTVTLKLDAPADIYVDGRRRGTRSWTGELGVGTHQVECRLEQHRPSVQTITVGANEVRTINLTPPALITGTLSITSQPAGALIKIDGKTYGQTPATIADLVVGHHLVELEGQDMGGRQEFDIAEGKTTTLNLQLAVKVMGLCPDQNHPHQIDMGDAGYWACCNVGAKTPTEKGNLYAWGEVVPKQEYWRSNYKWEDFDKHKITKYKGGGKQTLKAEDDVATVIWGKEWRMPTLDECKALALGCELSWTTIDGVEGYKMTAENGNSIFLPMTDPGVNGTFCWSSILYNIADYNEVNDFYAYALGFFLKEKVSTYHYMRFNGYPVRPVAK